MDRLWAVVLGRLTLLSEASLHLAAVSRMLLGSPSHCPENSQPIAQGEAHNVLGDLDTEDALSPNNA